MPDIEIRPRHPEDDEHIVSISNQMVPELPPATVEELRFRFDNPEPDLRSLYLVATEQGNVVGGAALSEARHPDSHPFFVSLGVEPESRRRGVGTALYERLVMQAKEWKADRLVGDVFEGRDDGMAFARSRGFEETGHGERFSRLDVSTANLEKFEGVEQRLIGRGIVICSLAELPVDDATLMAAVHEAAMESRRDIPGAEPQEPSPYEEWSNAILNGVGRSPEWYWVALNGSRPVGVAGLRRAGVECAWNGYTGVIREFRGQGVARALKRRTVDWSRANGVRYLYTGNEVANYPMLAINGDLGYEPLPRAITMRKELAAG